MCGASIMALRMPNGSLRPLAIGETIRRLTSKVAVDLITDRPRTQFSRDSPAGRQDAEWVQSHHPCHSTVVFTAIAPIRARLQSRWTSPVRSTRCAVPRSCRRSAPISLRSRLGSTVVTVTRAPCSPAPAVSLLRLSPAQEAFSKETRSPRKHDKQRRPPTPVASACAPFSSMTG